MALRLRRGTDAERQLITPVEGELIYTTDTKLLYVGDGSTAGGTLVTGAGGGGSSTLDGLTDTDLTGAANDDVLTFNGITNKWEAVAVPGVGSVAIDDLSDVLIYDLGFKDVLGYDGLIWRPYRASELIDPGCNLNINIVGDDSTILVNTDNNTFTGDLIGDVTGDLTGNVTGDVTGDLIGNVTGDLTGDVTGNFNGSINAIGTLDGDLQGSVFGDDSTLIIDGINNTIYTNRLTLDNSSISYSGPDIEPIVISNENRTPVKVRAITSGTLGGYPYFEINGVKGSFENPTNVASGEVAGAWKISGFVSGINDPSAVIGVGSFAASATMSDDSPASVFTLVTGGGGTSFNLFSFDQLGQFAAPGPVTPGVFADPTARDAAITTPAAGMIVFLTDSTGVGGAAKHQGYDGSSWNDLY